MSVIGISADGNRNMPNNECCHIEDCHKALIFNSFQITHGIFVACLVKSSFELKADHGFCAQCENSIYQKPAWRRIYACLFCKYFGCLAHKEMFGDTERQERYLAHTLPNHIKVHAEQKKHYLAMDIDLGFVLCFKCHTIIHDPVLEKVAFIQKKIAVKNALPRPPTIFQISDVTATSVQLSWSYGIGSDNISHYVIQYKPKQANQEYSEISGITTMFYAVQNLSPYTEYEFSVIAVNGIKRGFRSTPVVVSTGQTGLFKASFIPPEKRNSRSVKSKRKHSKNQVELKKVEKTWPLPSHSYEGLRNFSNLGQSCYMSSVLQAIIHAPFIAHLYLEENYPEFLSGEHKEMCLSRELRNLVREIYSGETKPLTYRKFYQIFFIKSSLFFKPDEQEDANLFLRELLNIEGIHQKEEQESKCGLQGCVLNEAFAKKIDSKKICEKCNYEKKLNDQSRDIISLCGENSNIIPGVTEALRSWSFEPSVAFSCDRPCDNSCKSRCDGKVARLEHTITQLPEIFVFHVQQKEALQEEVTSESKESKKSKKVLVPEKLNFENTLDMASFMPSQNKCQNSKYYLFAVIEHKKAKGSGGHYVAYIKTSEWFKFDDLESSAKKIENDCDISQINPFLLFYHRGL